MRQSFGNQFPLSKWRSARWNFPGAALAICWLLGAPAAQGQFAPAVDGELATMIMSETCQQNPQKSCRDAGCHPKETKETFGRHIVHPVYLEQRCTRCHVYPDSFWAPLLEKHPTALCLSCHFDVGWTFPEIQLAHPPEKSKCTICHSPHESRVRNRLKSEETLKACSICHKDFLEESNKMPYRHQHFELKTECGFCHTSHRRGLGKFVRENASESCLTCHDMSIRYKGRFLENTAARLKTAPYVHKAMEKGSCPVCHTPHGSVQPFLLKAGYPAGAYENYTPEIYALCSQCHPKTLDEFMDDEKTDFRHGALNLHRQHVVQIGRGRACHLCHQAHASERPHLLKDNIVFKEWNAPFGFTAMDDGGSCVTPCHRDQTYKRNILTGIDPPPATSSTLPSQATSPR